jgi:PilZ domain
VQLDIEFTIGDKQHRSKTRNLSLGGAFVDTEVKPPFNSRVQLRFNIPNQREAILVGGVVRWSDPGGFGVQFDGLRARDVWALGKFFEQL